MKIDFGEYLESLKGEKYRCCLIHHESCAALRRFAQQAAARCQGEYLNLLEYFNRHEELAQQIDVFDIEQFAALLKAQSAGKALLVVNNMDFLLDTWHKQEKEAFYRLIKDRWNSYFKKTQATLVFCVHSGHDLQDVEILDTKGNSRIHPLSDFKVIA